MAKKSTKAPPSQEARDAVLSVVQSAAGPLAATEVAKRLPAEHGLKPAKVGEILEGFAEAGELRRFSETTAKGKTRYWNRDLGEAIALGVSAVLEQMPEPLTLKEFASQIPGTQLTEADIEPKVRELVALGRLHEIPASGKGQPRFWNQDWAQKVLAAVNACLDASQVKLTIKEIAGGNPGPPRLSETDVAPVVQQLVNSGTVYEYPSIAPAKAKAGAKPKPPRYSRRTPLEIASTLVNELVIAKGAQTEAALKKELGKELTGELVERTFAGLREAGQLHRHPPKGKARELVYHSKAVDPLNHLDKVEKELEAAVAVLRKCDVSDDRLLRGLIEIAHRAGIKLEVAQSPGAAGLAPNRQATSAVPDLLALMKRLDPHAAGGSLVGAAEVRAVAGMSKEAFDAEAIRLSQAGKVSLHRHDYVASVSAEERDGMITDGAGNYFVGLAIRQ